MTSVPECFSESYAEARPKFCSAAAAAGGALRSWLNPKARGPNGEALYLDTARFGPADAPNMLVLISSTHGVEGHCGSGAQIAWLRDRRRRRSCPRTPARWSIHAINPYGFAWTPPGDRGQRRSQPQLRRSRQGLSGERRLPRHRRRRPAAASGTRPARPRPRRVFAAYAQKHGAFGLQGAISAGQYTHPDGIFFGGAQPTWSNRTIRAIAREELVARAPRRHHRLPYRPRPVRPWRADLRGVALGQVVRPRQGLVRRRDDLAGGRHLDVGDRGGHA